MSNTFARGLYWVGASTIAGRAARILSLFLLAGLLPAEDFGRYAALYVIVDGLLLLQGFGIGHSLVIDRSRSDASTDTVFSLSITIAAALTVIGIAGAGLVESFTGIAGIGDAFRAACFLVLIQGFRLVPQRLFDRELDFQKKFVPTLLSSFGYLVVAVGLAWRGAGVWALVLGELAAFALETIAYWSLTSRKPRFRFEVDSVRRHLGFGWPVFGGTILIYLIRSIDKFSISRGPGAVELGIFAFALSIAMIPANVVARMINTVLFPHYAAGESQRDRNDLFLSALRGMIGFGVCFALVLILFGGFLLDSVYGDKWADAVVPLAVLAVLGLFRTLTALLSDLYVGSSRPGLFRVMSLVQLVAAGAGLLVIAERASVPVAVVMTTAAGIAVLFGVVAARSKIDLSIGAFLLAWRAPVIAGILPVTLWAAARTVSPEVAFAATATALSFGVFGYVATWLALDAKTRGILIENLRRARAGAFGRRKA